MYWAFQERKQVYRERATRSLNESRANTGLVGKKVARNKNPCNKNPTSTGWDYCSCLQLSVQLFSRNKEVAYKIALSKSPFTHH